MIDIEDAIEGTEPETAGSALRAAEVLEQLHADTRRGQEHIRRALSASNKAGMAHAALLNPQGMHALTTAYARLKRTIGETTRILQCEFRSVVLPHPLLLPDGRPSTAVSALRIRSAKYENGRERHEPRIMDMLHVALPHDTPADDPLRKYTGWVGSPARLALGQDRSVVPEGRIDEAHEIGRLWDLMTAASYIGEHEGRGDGFVFAARSVEHGAHPEFAMDGTKLRLPQSLPSSLLDQTIDRQRDLLTATIATHLKRPEGAHIPFDRVLYLKSGEIPKGLRKHRDGTTPRTLLDAMAPLDGREPTKPVELRFADSSQPHANGTVGISGPDRTRREFHTGDMVALAFPQASTLVRAQITDASVKEYGALDDTDAQDAGATGIASLRTLLSHIFPGGISPKKLIALLRLHTFGRQALPYTRTLE